MSGTFENALITGGAGCDWLASGPPASWRRDQRRYDRRRPLFWVRLAPAVGREGFPRQT